MALIDDLAKAARVTAAAIDFLGARRAPLPAYRFDLELDLLGQSGRRLVAACTEISGLECELSTAEYQEGGQNGYVHRFRDRATWPNLVLKHGLMEDDALWRWHQDTIRGDVVRRNGAVVLRDAAGEPAMRWSFSAAMPVKWSVPALNAGTSALAFETIELVHRGLELSVLRG
ncbi:phage tail protein [Nevskia sp.]|uniref:phage tail protein n=1 Tax=Nevskia sp. TaxID=1929292 RepID=UPI0025F30895|nr:phage tail protein [Nevskia sp.]